MSVWKTCAGSAFGQHNVPNRDGFCTWCGCKIAGPPTKPPPQEESALTVYYEYFYDPNWGSK